MRLPGFGCWQTISTVVLTGQLTVLSAELDRQHWTSHNIPSWPLGPGVSSASVHIRACTGLQLRGRRMGILDRTGGIITNAGRIPHTDVQMLLANLESPCDSGTPMLGGREELTQQHGCHPVRAGGPVLPRRHPHGVC